MASEMTVRVRRIVANFLRQADGACPELGDEENLFEGGFLDSTAFFELISTIEEELEASIDFLDADAADLVSVAGLARHLERSIPPFESAYGATGQDRGQGP